jgi:hypothetical protein
MLNNIIKTIQRGHEINREDYPSILEALIAYKQLLEEQNTDDLGDCCPRCDKPLKEQNYDSEYCDSCIEHEIDKRESYKGETY